MFTDAVVSLSAARWRPFALAAGWTLLFALVILVRPVPALTRPFDDSATTATALAAAAAAAWAAARLAGRLRVAWALLAAGCASWGIGNGIWTVYELALGRDVPFPSAADVFYLAAIPLAATGVLLLLAPRRRPTLLLRAVLDGAIIAGALFFISWGTVGQVVAAHAEADPLKFVVAVAYPFGDVVIVTAAIFAAGQASRAAWPTLLTLALGWVAFGVADSSFAYATAVGTYSTGNLLDAGWTAGLSLVAVAAILAPAHQWPVPAPEARAAVSPYAVYPILVAAIAFRIVFAGSAAGGPVLSPVGMAVVIMMLVRQVLIGLDNSYLERERAAALSALRTSEHRLEQVLVHGAATVFAFDADGRCVLARGSGVPNPERQIGKLVDDFSNAEARATFRRALAGAATTTRLRTGANRILELRCTPMFEGGRVTGMVGVGLDVTERVEAEEARRESAAKDRFLANMSHELRTPLNSILGFAQLLGREDFGPLTERQLRYQQNILGSGAQLLELINELLDLAKVRAGELDVELAPVVIQPVLADAVDSVRPQADAAGLTLEFEPPRELVAQADVRRLRQVLLNLLSNAVKFTPPGGAIHVAAHAAAGEVRIDISDTGIGVPESDRDRIFEEFTQLDDGRQRGGTGTGLGLALARALARRMGGEITVTTREPGGSVFSVSLPAVG